MSVMVGSLFFLGTLIDLRSPPAFCTSPRSCAAS
jgi:hypothetical protein